MDKYIYLIWSLIFGFVWLLLYFRRTDVRSKMLLISFLFGFGGLISQNTHITDWWKPITITGTRLGLEDFLIGFFIGGISSVIYEEIYRKRTKIKLNHKIHLAILIVFPVLFLVSFHGFHLSSFYSALIAYLFGVFYIFWQRRDLIDDSIRSGFMMLIIGSTVYLLLDFIRPDFIRGFWYLPDVWYGNLFLGIPVGEYIWFFLTGAFIGPLYEFVETGRFVKQKN